MLLVCSLLLAAWPRVLAATREPAPLLRTRVKVGIIVHVERRHVESRVQRAVELFNAGSAFLMIEPIFVFTSDTDTLLRSGYALRIHSFCSMFQYFIFCPRGSILFIVNNLGLSRIVHYEAAKRLQSEECVPSGGGGGGGAAVAGPRLFLPGAVLASLLTR